MSNERPRRYSSWQERVAGGALEAHNEMRDALFEKGLKAAPKSVRVVVGAAGSAPGLVYNLGKLAGAKDKWREGFGIAGSVIGGTAGGALGTAAGGVNAPIGTIIGSSLGEDVGKDIYDQHKAYIQQHIARPVDGAIHRAHEAIDENLAKVAATKLWIDGRNASLKRR